MQGLYCSIAYYCQYYYYYSFSHRRRRRRRRRCSRSRRFSSHSAARIFSLHIMEPAGQAVFSFTFSFVVTLTTLY